MKQYHKTEWIAGQTVIKKTFMARLETFLEEIGQEAICLYNENDVYTGGDIVVYNTEFWVAAKDISGVPPGTTTEADWVPYRKLDDAPEDGQQYARRDGAWSVIEAAAASNGPIYAYDSSETYTGGTMVLYDSKLWIAATTVTGVTPGTTTIEEWFQYGESFEDAPYDGTQYARQDGQWVAVESESALPVTLIASGGGQIMSLRTEFVDSETYTLPLAADVPIGFTLTMIIRSANNTITPTLVTRGSDNISYIGGIDNSVTLDAGATTFVIISDGISEWRF